MPRQSVKNRLFAKRTPCRPSYRSPAVLDVPAGKGHKARMSRTVHCVKLGKEAEGLEKPPVKGELGQRIFDNVSKEGWQQWVAHSTMLVNEYRLEAGTPEAMRIWLAELEKFFFGEGSDLPEEYVPPETKSSDE